MVKHTFFMALSTALRLLTGVVIFVVMARIWGPEKFGSFMYWFTVTSLAALLVDYGFSQQLMRDVGQDKERASELIAGVMSAKLLLAGGMVVLGALVSFTPWCQEQPVTLFWTLLLTCIAGSFAETFNAVFRGLGQFHEETTIAAWVNFSHFALVAVLLVLDVGVIGVAIGFLLSRVFFLFLALRTYRRLVPATNSVSNANFSDGLRNLKAGFPFAAEAAFTNFQAQADTLIVQHFLGPAAVGVYQAGLRLMQGANTFAQVLSNVYLPAMAGQANEKARLTKLTNRLFLQMLLLGAVCMLVFTVGAKPITNMLYGPQFNALINLMPWFGLLLLMRYVAASHGVTLSAIGLQSTRVGAIAAALTVLFAATYLLIPSFGLLGMLYASILAIGCLYLVYAGTLLTRDISLGINKPNAVLLVAVAAAAIFLIADH